MPFVIEVPDDRCSVRRRLVMNTQRVCFIHFVAVVARGDVVLVLHPLVYVGNESLPDSRRPARLEAICLITPSVPIAFDADTLRIRRPNGEHRPGDTFALHRMRAQLLP